MKSDVVRPWVKSDGPAIAAIMADHALWQHYGLTYEMALPRLDRLFEQGEWGFVASRSTTQDMLDGFVLFNATTFGESGYIRLLGVNSSTMSHGIGARLLRRVEQSLSQRGISRLTLLCTDWNTRAQKFYEHEGFSRVGLLQDWVMLGTGEIIYAKKLVGTQPFPQSTPSGGLASPDS